jgi:hypothetical protein
VGGDEVATERTRNSERISERIHVRHPTLVPPNEAAFLCGPVVAIAVSALSALPAWEGNAQTSRLTGVQRRKM